MPIIKDIFIRSNRRDPTIGIDDFRFICTYRENNVFTGFILTSFVIYRHFISR